MISRMKGEISYYWALWRTGKLPPERIPDVACDALQEGMDDPRLRYLAGLVNPTRRDIGTKFDDACQSLVIIPDVKDEVDAEFRYWLQTALPIAKAIAQQILDGTINPVEGWLSIPWCVDQPLGPLAVFFTFADRVGSVSFDEKFQRRVVAACEQFLSTLKASEQNH